MVVPFPLEGRVPLLSLSALGRDFLDNAQVFSDQLTDWGFMAFELPGIRNRTDELRTAFEEACESKDPSLGEYEYTVVPQLSAGGSHGYFAEATEVPRLSGGVPDPKEFIHVSGAMIDDTPSGAGGMLRAFPELASKANDVFKIGFDLAEGFGRLLSGILGPLSPGLGLSRELSILRVIHYMNTEGREVLAHEHSGIQMLGIQFPPSDGGLQYVLHDGTWVEPVLSGTDVVLCNIGRMLTFASNGRFRPSTHRVHTDQSSHEYERWSTVMFLHADHDARQWRLTGGGLERPEGTWGEFVAERARGLGIAHE